MEHQSQRDRSDALLDRVLCGRHVLKGMRHFLHRALAVVVLLASAQCNAQATDPFLIHGRAFISAIADGDLEKLGLLLKTPYIAKSGYREEDGRHIGFLDAAIVGQSSSSIISTSRITKCQPDVDVISFLIDNGFYYDGSIFDDQVATSQRPLYWPDRFRPFQCMFTHDKTSKKMKLTIPEEEFLRVVETLNNRPFTPPIIYANARGYGGDPLFFEAINLYMHGSLSYGATDRLFQLFQRWGMDKSLEGEGGEPLVHKLFMEILFRFRVNKDSYFNALLLLHKHGFDFNSLDPFGNNPSALAHSAPEISRYHAVVPRDGRRIYFEDAEAWELNVKDRYIYVPFEKRRENVRTDIVLQRNALRELRYRLKDLEIDWNPRYRRMKCVKGKLASGEQHEMRCMVADVPKWAEEN